MLEIPGREQLLSLVRSRTGSDAKCRPERMLNDDSFWPNGDLVLGGPVGPCADRDRVRFGRYFRIARRTLRRRSRVIASGASKEPRQRPIMGIARHCTLQK